MVKWKWNVSAGVKCKHAVGNISVHTYSGIRPRSTVFSPHRTRSINAGCCYGYRCVDVVSSVCLFVGHDRDSCKNGWTHRDTVWKAEDRVSSKNHVLVERHMAWRIPLDDSCSAAMRAVPAITVANSLSFKRIPALLTFYFYCCVYNRRILYY